MRSLYFLYWVIYFLYDYPKIWLWLQLKHDIYNLVDMSILLLSNYYFFRQPCSRTTTLLFGPDWMIHFHNSGLLNQLCRFIFTCTTLVILSYQMSLLKASSLHFTSLLWFFQPIYVYISSVLKNFYIHVSFNVFSTLKKW